MQRMLGDKYEALMGARAKATPLKRVVTADDVAEVVLFVLTRPRGHRILEVALRPVTETSWG